MELDIPSKSAEGMLTLMKLRGVGPQTATKLAKRFHRIGEIQSAAEDENSPIASARALRTLRQPAEWSKAHEIAHEQLDHATSQEVSILSIFDDGYPELLSAIPDAPAVLYVKGSLPKDNRSVACVGTREPSPFGSEVAKRITTALTANSYRVVSGLALGVDTICHEAALDANGHTVAVLANGLDTVYPAKNRDLATRILDSGGALVSEQPFGAKAFAQNLVQRDRLQSALSLATFVMQTDIVGGTMHTVRFTLLQGRLLFVPTPTPQHAEEPKFKGPRALAERTGSELAELLKARDDYQQLLQSQFRDTPPAVAISGQKDYERVFELLASSATRCSNPVAQVPSQPTLFDDL